MKVFSHLMKSRVHRSLLIGCILVFTGIYGIVYISPVLDGKHSDLRQYVFRNIQNVTSKKVHNVEEFNQSTEPRRFPLFFSRRKIIPDIPNYRNLVPSNGRLSYRLFRESFSRQLPPISHLDPSEIIDDPIMVIIVAYMHTGSTYIGSVFQQHPGTFYEYEPMRSLQKQAVENETAVYLNGSTKLVNLYNVDGRLKAEYVQKMLQCKHDKLDLATLIKYYFSLDSKLMRDSSLFFKCQNRRRWLDQPNSMTSRIQQRMKANFYTLESQKRVRDCLPYLTNNCLKAKIRVSKFIRIGLDSVEHLLTDFPQVKVIHLFRDPRAMMDSQVRKNDFGTKKKFPEFIFQTKKMCSRIRQDIRQRFLLKDKYPGQVMGLRYEDFTKAPVAASKAMFEFTGVPFTQSDSTFVRRTSVVAAKNSTVREGVWRGHMDQAHLDIVNTHCSDVMFDLGYIQYRSIAEIRNYDLPTNNFTKLTDFVST